MSRTLRVDIWSDIACPWCFIGKRRFEEGLRRFNAADPTVEVQVEYHSFELAPDTPVDFEGSEVDFLARHKQMPAGEVERMLTHMTELAAAEGLAYDFGALRHTKTLKAHEALHLAKAQGQQVALKERLLRAYFEEGRHLGDIDELVELAAEVGLDPHDVRDALEQGSYADDVRADIEQAWEYGISGVPFYVVDGRYGISGAQGPEVFARALREAADEKQAART